MAKAKTTSAKNTLSIPVTLPPGFVPSAKDMARAQTSAQAVLDQSAFLSALGALLNKLDKKGFNVTPAQWALLNANDAAKPFRPRVMLDASQREEVERKLAAGATGSAIMREFGISMATVNNIKRAAGLIRSRWKAGTPARKGKKATA